MMGDCTRCGSRQHNIGQCPWPSTACATLYVNEPPNIRRIVGWSDTQPVTPIFLAEITVTQDISSDGFYIVLEGEGKRSPDIPIEAAMSLAEKTVMRIRLDTSGENPVDKPKFTDKYEVRT